MSRAYISRLENGNVSSPKVNDLASVAAALEWPLDCLLFGEVSAEGLEDALTLRFGSSVGEQVTDIILGLVVARPDRISTITQVVRTLLNEEPRAAVAS